ncbi:MAG: dipeptidase [Chitinophagaceae bacterium]
MRNQSSDKLHFSSVLVDTHNDFLSKSLEKNYSFDTNLKGKTHSDLQRMFEGGVDIQIFSVWCDAREDAFAHANHEIDSLDAFIKRNPKKMKMVRSYADAEFAIKHKMLGAMIGVEGGHMIEDDLAKLETLYKRGARYMTLTWNNNPTWATSAMYENENKDKDVRKGLTDFGRQVVKKMNELGMMVDLSHVGEQTFKDAISISTKPIILSHSSVWNISPVFRNAKDYQLDMIKQNNGVICVNFFSGFIDSNFNARNKAFNARHKAEKDSLLNAGKEDFFAEDYLFEKYADEVKTLRPPFSLLIDHIDYLVKRIGADHVGIGSDFDGISSAPMEMDGAEDYPKITAALKQRGYTDSDVSKILGGNVLRVFRENQKK